MEKSKEDQPPDTTSILNTKADNEEGEEKQMLTKKETIHSYLSTMKRHARSVKLLFTDDESVVSSTICEDPAYQNQIQSQDDPHGRQAIDISEDDIVLNEESEGATKTQ